MPTLKAIRYSVNILPFLLIHFRYSQSFLMSWRDVAGLRDDTTNGYVADYFRYGTNTEPIRYVTLHFRDRRGAASLRYRNRAGITVRWPLDRGSETISRQSFTLLLTFYFILYLYFDRSHQTLTHLILAASDCYGINITTFAILPDISRETIWRWGTTP